VVSAARPVYGVPEDAPIDDGSRGFGGVFVLFLIVIGLGVVTMWYAVLPALHTAPTAQRSCEVVVLASGATKCVATPTRAPQTAAHKPSGRAKH
jgi:hypothetical protein